VGGGGGGRAWSGGGGGGGWGGGVFCGWGGGGGGGAPSEQEGTNYNPTGQTIREQEWKRRKRKIEGSEEGAKGGGG